MELLDYFSALSAIPRPSGGEGAVTAYLNRTLSALGLVPEVDEAYNLRCLLPASPRRENSPGIILQAHTDMVCVTASPDYHPGKDPITLRYEGDYLCSDGRSSLGADNGIAAAAMLHLAEHRNFDHGPILLLFTACEETGLVGAKALDPAWLEGYQYYVNLDAFRADAVIFASAGGLRQRWNLPIHTRPSEKRNSFTLCLTGLTGGHSGFDIHRGRGNAIDLLLQVLDGYPLDLAWFDGGSDFNAIPTTAMAVVTVDDPVDFRDYVTRQHQTLAAAWGGTDPNLCLAATDCQHPAAVWDESIRNAVRSFFTSLPMGVQSWRQDVANTAASSGNPAVLKDLGNVVCMDHFARCDTPEEMERITQNTQASAKEYGFTQVELAEYSPWAGQADNPLTRMAQRIYRDLTGQAMETVALHVGLEASLILEKNPALTGIALGCDISDAHSVSERVRLDSIPRMEELLRRMLMEL